MQNKVDYYLSKGFDRKMAEYFSNGRRKIMSVSPNRDFSLTITFDNGEKRILDMKDCLKPATVFEPFMIWDNFSRVYLDENQCISWDIDPTVDSSVFWNNKVDLCPDSCYTDSVPIQ